MPKAPDGGKSEEQVIWGGVVEVSLSANHRYTVKDAGVKVSPRGTTTVISILDKPQLIGWSVGEALDYVYENKQHIDDPQIWVNAQQAAEGKKGEAATIGNAIHDWCDQYIKGNAVEMPTDPNVLRGVVSFLHWVDEHKVRFIESERFVYSREHNYVGKFDFTMWVDEMRCMGDLKTGNGLYPTVAMQTAAYAQALTEETGEYFNGRWAIRVAKETETEYIDRCHKKNESRERRGLKPQAIKPYVPFEAKFFSNDTLEHDFSAFLWCNKLTNWNNETSRAFRNND